MNQLPYRHIPQLINLLKHTFSKYTIHGLTIIDVFADNEFDQDNLQHEILQLTYIYVLKMNTSLSLSGPYVQLGNKLSLC